MATIGGADFARVEEWSYAGAPGQLITTPNYRLHCTLENPSLMERLPLFMELAGEHYRTAIVELPPPRRRMESFIFGARDQWERYAQELMGVNAAPYLRIGRGGFSAGGRAVLYDIGVSDTLAIAAHEGWHQFAQSSFEDSLPIWLEEGMATFMEGHRFVDGSPVFMPWSNPERFDLLRRATYSRRSRLMSVQEVLQTHPEDALARSNRSALLYYAQVWSLTHFLHEGADGRYRDRLRLLLRDTAEGRLDRRVRSTLRARGDSTVGLNTRTGDAVFRAYFTDDLEAFDRDYQAFVRDMVRSGKRGRMLLGESPLGDPTTP